MKTHATVREQAVNVGRGRMRLTAAVFVALLMLGMTMGAGGAYSIGQHEYVQNCKGAGGTSKSVGTRRVKCTIGNWSQTCDFNFDPPSCSSSFSVPLSDPHAPAGGGVLETGGSATNDPLSPVGGGVLVQTEIAPTTPDRGGGVLVMTTAETVSVPPETASTDQDPRFVTAVVTTDSATIVSDDAEQP